jgi:hypothetical protein
MSVYVGYVFRCSAESLGACLRSKVFSCSGEDVEAAHDVAAGSTVFLLDERSDRLVGPFTVAESARTSLESGAWVEGMDERSFSLNFRVEWEELHDVNHARERFPFLKNFETCSLSRLQIRDLLDGLKKGKPLSGTRDSSPSRK